VYARTVRGKKELIHRTFAPVVDDDDDAWDELLSLFVPRIYDLD